MNFNYEYERRVGDIPIAEFLSALDKIVEKNIENTLKKYLPTLENYINAVQTKEELSTTKEVCKILKISRPTLIGWYKKEDTKKLLVGTMEKIGNKNMYHLNIIKTIIKNNERVFGKDRIYYYKSEAKRREGFKLNETTEQIVENNLSKLTVSELYKKMNTGFELTEDESNFLRKNAF